TNDQQSLTNAQTALATAAAASPQIVAPFNGVVTSLNATPSATVGKGQTAMVIAQNGKYVANMMVNETEMPDISIGTMATVTVSALPNVTLSSEVNTISPTASNSSGVVNYAATATILGVVPQTTRTITTTPSGQSGTTTTTTTTTTSSGQSGTTITPTTTRQPRTTPATTGTSTT